MRQGSPQDMRWKQSLGAPVALLRVMLKHWPYRWLMLAVMVTLVFEPVVVAAAVVWAKYGRLKLSLFFAREEVLAALSVPFQGFSLQAATLSTVSKLRSSPNSIFIPGFRFDG